MKQEPKFKNGSLRSRIRERRTNFLDAQGLGTSRTGAIATELALGAGQPLEPPGGDYLQQLKDSLWENIQTARTPQEWPLWLLCASGWVMLDLTDSELLYPEKLWINYLSALEGKGGVLAGRILLYSYLRLYPHDRPYYESLRATLFRLLTRGSSPAARYRYTYLTQTVLAANGPQLLAQRLLHTDPGKYLSKLGLSGELTRGGFMEAAWESLAARLTQGEFPDISSTANRVFLALSLENNGKLRFPKRLVELAHGLLMPWIGRGMDLPPGIRNLLFTHLGEPRSPSVLWTGVFPEARAVICQSLAGGVIEDFFLLLEILALHEPDINPHRHERRAFWWDAWKRGAITDAWIALSSGISPDTIRRLGTRNYAIIAGWGRSSALLLIIDGVHVIEWSHSAVDLIWYAQNPTAPQFYKLRYNSEELTHSADYSFSSPEPQI